MKHLATAASLLALSAGAVTAGGIDRSRLNYGILFEKGSYVEFGASRVSPDVSGTFAAALGGISTGDMAGNYATFSLSYKQDINDKLSFGLFVNTPYGADASYQTGVYNGLRAQWDSNQIAGILRYEVTPAISVYGGLRYVQSKATISIPDTLIRGGLAQAAANPNLSAERRAQAGALAGGAPPGTLAYEASGASDGRFGYVIGAAYEKPEIALRVALTYESGITHKFNTTEFIAAVPSISGNGVTEVEMPKSITLDFQSGIAKDTLAFGSIRWSEWSVWEVRPPGYNALTGSDITSFENDVITYQIGIGRKLNDNWSIFTRASYEKANGGVSSRLAPTDGQSTFGVGGTYTKDNLKVTGGVEYIRVGDAVDGSNTQFGSNDGIGFGLSVGYRF